MSANCNHKTCEGETCRRPKQPKPRKPLNRVSKKRSRENRSYSVLRKQFFKEGDLCEARLEGCTGLATDLHHPQGRIGKRLTDVKKCKKVCRNCHDKIHNDPVTAKELGLSESRLT